MTARARSPGDTDRRAPSIKYQPRAQRYYFDVGIGSVCLSGADTGGAYCLLEVSLAPGMGVPRHTHTREDEAYYVLAGELEVGVGDEVFVLNVGDTLIAPRDIPPRDTQFGHRRESLSPHVLAFRVRGISEGDGGSGAGPCGCSNRATRRCRSECPGAHRRLWNSFWLIGGLCCGEIAARRWRLPSAQVARSPTSSRAPPREFRSRRRPLEQPRDEGRRD
jgi:mannose-6-phosphate isomerase-like protein (cupin superfamily)